MAEEWGQLTVLQDIEVEGPNGREVLVKKDTIYKLRRPTVKVGREVYGDGAVNLDWLRGQQTMISSHHFDIYQPDGDVSWPASLPQSCTARQVVSLDTHVHGGSLLWERKPYLTTMNRG